MDRRGKGERPAVVCSDEAEYLDREPALKAEWVMARSCEGSHRANQLKVAPQIKGSVL